MKEKLKPSTNESKLKSCHIGLIIVIAVAILIGIAALIYTIATSSESELTSTTESFDYDALIGDGICDESTNTEQHFYDGGDCCMDIHRKDTSLCKICTCQLTVDNAELIQSFEQQGVKRLIEVEKFTSLTELLSHVTTNVETVEVCSTLCLSDDLRNTVNGWSYDSVLQVCTCAWLGQSRCLQDLTLEDQTNPRSSTKDGIIAYIQTVKVTDNCESTTMTSTTSTVATTTTTTTASTATAMEGEALSTIPSDWMTLEDGKEITFIKCIHNYYAAVQQCLNVGGRLYEPKDFEEMREVIFMGCESGIACEVWIGVTDVFSEGNFVYLSDGSPVLEDVAMWRVNEPNNLQEIEHFVTVQPDFAMNKYSWNDMAETLNDDYSVDAVCERGSGTNYDVIEISGGLKIFFGFEPLALQDAIMFCNNRGGRVYEPRNLDQVQEVAMRATEARLLHGHWIGIADIEEEGRFVYLSDGQPINELATDWSEGEPNNFLHSHPPFELDEDGVNSVPFLEGKWNDIPEHFTYHVVCEIIW